MENAKLKKMPLRSLAFNFITFFTIIIPLNILAQNSFSPQFYEREETLVNIYNNDPQNEQNLISMGELYVSEKIWDLAIDSYEKLVDLNPDNPDYLYRLGGTQAAYSEVVSKFRVLSLINTAKRNLIKVPLKDGRTLHHDVKGKNGSGKVFLRAAPAGTGIIAGGAIRSVCEVLGIQDVVAKSLGSANPHNVLKACVNGLRSQNSPKILSAIRGKKISDIVQKREAK